MIDACANQPEIAGMKPQTVDFNKIPCDLHKLVRELGLIELARSGRNHRRFQIPTALAADRKDPIFACSLTP